MIREALTDEEIYFYALTQDESGLDLAEFLFIDETDETEDQSGDCCFRAWPFQFAWWRTNKPKTIDAGSRSCGKSLSIKFRALAFPFIHPGEEMVITAPEANHLTAVTDNIETLYYHVKLAREMLIGGPGAIKHKPFHMNFSNGCRIMGRIPKYDGSGVKGIHPIWLEHDEAQDYPEPGWKEVVSTVKVNNPKSRWRVHGVTRGVGDTFDDKITGKDSTWHVTNLPAMYRPNWNDQERADKVEEFHGYDSPDYRRNVLGLPGDGNSPMFVLHRIMENVVLDMQDPYNAVEYYKTYIDEAMIREVESVNDLIEIPATHLKYKNFWIGMDFGWTNNPSAIIVFAEVKNPKKDETALKVLTNILLKRVSPMDQFKVIVNLMDTYHPIGYAFDATGAGQPVMSIFQDLLRSDDDNSWMLDRIKNFGFSEKIIVDFDTSIPIDEDDPDSWKKAAIARPFLEASADAMRMLIDSTRMIMPYDKQLIGELQSAPKNNKPIPDAYGKTTQRKSGQHTLDAIRMAVLAQQTHHIDEFIARHENVWQPPAMILL